MVICACPDRVVPGEFETDTDTTSATGDTEDATLTGGPQSTLAEPTGPGPAPTTTDPGGDASAGSGGGDGSTTDEPPASCGPPCGSPWFHEGPVILNGGGADFACMREMKGDLYIGPDADPAEIASLANLERVEGEVTVAGNLKLADLSGLDCLREVESLTLAAMPQLADLDALAGLQRAPVLVFDGLGITSLPAFAPEFTGVSSLALRNNAALVDLAAASAWGAGDGPLVLLITGDAALPELSGLAGLLADNGADKVHIELADLPALTSLTGLEPVVFADLHFERLPQVTDFAPLANLELGGQITFNDIPQVTNLAGLAALASVGTFTIGDCAHAGAGGMDGLVSLAGLASLAKVGHLALADNDKLASLAGAPALTELQGFAAVGNPVLSLDEFEAFLEQLETEPWTCHGGWDRCACSLVIPG